MRLTDFRNEPLMDPPHPFRTFPHPDSTPPYRVNFCCTPLQAWGQDLLYHRTEQPTHPYLWVLWQYGRTLPHVTRLKPSSGYSYHPRGDSDDPEPP
eukprot:763482-Hanusia_phi.AAC.8